MSRKARLKARRVKKESKNPFLDEVECSISSCGLDAELSNGESSFVNTINLGVSLVGPLYTTLEDQWVLVAGTAVYSTSGWTGPERSNEE